MKRALGVLCFLGGLTWLADAAAMAADMPEAQGLPMAVCACLVAAVILLSLGSTIIIRSLP